MPYLVNGQLVTQDAVQAQEAQLRRDPQWQRIADEAERARRLRAAAEFAAVDVAVFEQATASDPRPIDPVTIQHELQRQIKMGNCRNANDERRLCQLIEREFRLHRAAQEMVAGAPLPSSEDLEAFYQVQKENFRGSALFRAAHVVKHTNGGQNEEEARAGIEAALKMLESGAPFAEVADRHSDCPGKGGDLGEFVAGAMVPEFEDAIRDLKPGERTGIFRTGFGFHIAELRAKVPAGVVSFEEVREDIRRTLTIMRQHQAFQRAVAQLRSRAHVQWVPEATPPQQNHEHDQAGVCQ